MSAVRKVLGFAGALKGAVDTVGDIISAGKAILVMHDRLDDDLDDNGKGEFQDCLDEVDGILDDTVAFGKETFQRILRLVSRVKRLGRYVSTGDKGESK